MFTDHLDVNDPIIVCCCRDGTISYHKRGQPSFNGRALPVLSVRTEQEIKDLQVLTCRLQREDHPLMAPGESWFVLGSGPFAEGFSGNAEDLDKVGDYLAEKLILVRKALKTGHKVTGL